MKTFFGKGFFLFKSTNNKFSNGLTEKSSYISLYNPKETPWSSDKLKFRGCFFGSSGRMNSQYKAIIYLNINMVIANNNISVMSKHLKI